MAVLEAGDVARGTLDRVGKRQHFDFERVGKGSFYLLGQRSLEHDLILEGVKERG